MITPYFYPHRGGVETHVWQICKRLQKRGWRVRVITQKDKLSLPDQESIGQLEIKRICFPHQKIVGLLVIWWRVLTSALRCARESEVIHIHDVLLWCLPLRLIFPRKKIILTVHGWEGHYPVLKKERWLKRLSVGLASYCFGVGHYLKKYYQVQCNRWIYGGVSLATESENGLRPNRTKRVWKMAYLGRLARDTGLPILLKSLSELGERDLKKISPQFIGDGALRDDCEKWGQVTGWLNDQQVNERLRQTEVIIASGYLSALEAWAAGCEVIAVADNQLKLDYWLLSPFAGWLHMACSQQELTNLQKMIASGQLAKRCPVFSQLQTFSWSKLVDEYEKGYLV